MNTFTADLHLHTDGEFNGHARHGEEPKAMAAAIHRRGLDAYAITEHNVPSFERFQEIRARIVALQQGVWQKTVGFLGVELSLMDGDRKHHVGYIFDNPNIEYQPEVPAQYAPMSELAELKKHEPGVAILHHPTWRDRDEDDMGSTIDTILQNQDNLDGIELFNYMWMNGQSEQNPKAELNLRVADAVMQSSLLSMVGSSDAHSAEHVAMCSTAFRAERPEDLPRAIRTRNTLPMIADSAGKFRNGLIASIRKFGLKRAGAFLGLTRTQVRDNTPPFVQEKRRLERKRRFGA